MVCLGHMHGLCRKSSQNVDPTITVPLHTSDSARNGEREISCTRVFRPPFPFLRGPTAPEYSFLAVCLQAYQGPEQCVSPQSNCASSKNNLCVISGHLARSMANLVSKNGNFQPVFRTIVLKVHNDR